jgi:hypothetical protein
MATIKVTKSSSVKSIKKQFAKEFNCNIRIYKGNKFADDTTKISELTKKNDFNGKLELGPRSRVGNVEDYFRKEFGIKIQISNANDSKLAKNEMTLTQAGKI